MLTIPIQSVPNQTFNVLLNGQQVTVNIYMITEDTRLYMDVELNNEPVVLGVPCQNLNRVIRNLYFGFIGDFVFNDTQGSSDPFWSGLGTRFVLNYLQAAEANNA